jgi:pyruvate,water dikinase
MDQVKPGDVLVADMTDPNWEPVMKRASAIVTNRGGRTCHAAIIARELGIPAIVGCGDATETLTEGEDRHGQLHGRRYRPRLSRQPRLRSHHPRHLGHAGRPGQGHDERRQPGTGLRIRPAAERRRRSGPRRVHHQQRHRHPPEGHPRRRAPAGFEARGNQAPRPRLRLAEGLLHREAGRRRATIAAAFWPNPVIVRLSDFKSNEYRKLLGGELYEPEEENPMLGFRGASRYIAHTFEDCFEMECIAMKRVREEMGLTNVQLMVPFVRTVGEGKAVVELLAEHGLKQGENDLKLIMMCEIPSNALLADDFLKIFDGFSIGSNDLTQLTPRPRPRLRPGRQPLRRTRPGRQDAAGDGDLRRQQGRQVHRHLRPGPVRPPRSGRMADGSGHQQHLAEPGYRG